MNLSFSCRIRYRQAEKIDNTTSCLNKSSLPCFFSHLQWLSYNKKLKWEDSYVTSKIKSGSFSCTNWVHDLFLKGWMQLLPIGSFIMWSLISSSARQCRASPARILFFLLLLLSFGHFYIALLFASTRIYSFMSSCFLQLAESSHISLATKDLNNTTREGEQNSIPSLAVCKTLPCLEPWKPWRFHKSFPGLAK